MGKLSVFFLLPFARKRMLWQIFFLSGWNRFQMLYRPFPVISRRWGRPGLETDTLTANREMVKFVSWAVPAVCKRTPWKSLCLVQAMTARQLLLKQGISCTMYMGACRDEQGNAQAHAWLRSGDVLVTGGDGDLSRYAVTGVYGTEM